MWQTSNSFDGVERELSPLTAQLAEEAAMRIVEWMKK